MKAKWVVRFIIVMPPCHRVPVNDGKFPLRFIAIAHAFPGGFFRHLGRFLLESQLMLLAVFALAFHRRAFGGHFLRHAQWALGEHRAAEKRQSRLQAGSR